jgi:carbonic anhydrase
VDLFEGISRFQAHLFPNLAPRFAKLGEGQQPHTLFITCSDSRVDPSLITQTLPGELFVLRNAGNLVPAPEVDYATSSAVEYAVDALGVSQIVVCGHSGCGAMGATLDPSGLDALPHVARWLEIGGAKVLSDSLPEQVDANAKAQLEGLRAHPCVSRALTEGRLTLQAWTYEIPTGAVRRLALATS